MHPLFLLPILSSITFFLSLKHIWGKRNMNDSQGIPTGRRNHSQAEIIEENWSEAHEQNTGELCEWRSAQRWLKCGVRGRNIWFYFSITLFVALPLVLWLNVMFCDLEEIIGLYGSSEQSVDICLHLNFFFILNFAFFSFTASGKINK